MKAEFSRLPGVVFFRPTPHADERGWFTRTFDVEVAAEAGIEAARFVQDSQSRSVRGTVRGLHFRTDGGEAKLVRCSFGAVFDVAVDLRPESPTFLHWEGYQLDDESHLSVYLPVGIAHGFQALTDYADVCYRIDALHRPGAGAALAWKDPELAIPWPQPVGPMSPADRMAPQLAEIRGRLADWFG